MRFVILSLLVMAACGGGQQTLAPHPDLRGYSSSERPSEELCQHAVSNFERNEFLSTTTSVGRKGLFDRTAYDWRHRDRLRRCQTLLSEREAACIATAPSMQYVQNCQRYAELQ